MLDGDSPAVITPQRSWTWGELVSTRPRATSPRRAVVGDVSVDAIADTVAGLFAGDIVVLVHPRWPAAMRALAMARAGAGRPVPDGWNVDAHLGGTVVFSSGSTGVPKAIFHHTNAHLENAAAVNSVMPFQRGHRWLLSLPVCHVGGLAIVMRAMVGGGAVILADPGCSITDAVIATRPTHLSVVAAQLRTLLQSTEAVAVLRDADLVLVGGGPTPEALFRAGLDGGLPLRQTWGLSEMGSQVCTSGRGRPFTCGHPLPERRLVVDPDGRLWVGGTPLSAGFVDVDALVPLVPLGDADGLYATGDVGVIDDEGLRIVGRVDNQFISGGENIQPESIEAALADENVDVVVVAVDDAHFGKRPVAFYVGDNDADADDVVALLKDRAAMALPRFMHPVLYLPIPEDQGMKPQRRALEQLANTRYAAHTAVTTPATAATTTTTTTTTVSPSPENLRRRT
jgi:O-succinylbenzoic acid--CoA ligase